VELDAAQEVYSDGGGGRKIMDFLCVRLIMGRKEGAASARCFCNCGGEATTPGGVVFGGGRGGEKGTITITQHTQQR